MLLNVSLIKCSTLLGTKVVPGALSNNCLKSLKVLLSHDCVKFLSNGLLLITSLIYVTSYFKFSYTAVPNSFITFLVRVICSASSLELQ